MSKAGCYAASRHWQVPPPRPLAAHKCPPMLNARTACTPLTAVAVALAVASGADAGFLMSDDKRIASKQQTAAYACANVAPISTNVSISDICTHAATR